MVGLWRVLSQTCALLTRTTLFAFWHLSALFGMRSIVFFLDLAGLASSLLLLDPIEPAALIVSDVPPAVLLSEFQGLLTAFAASTVEDHLVVVCGTLEGKFAQKVASITRKGFLELRERYVDSRRNDALGDLVGFANVDDRDLTRGRGGFRFEFRVLDRAARCPTCVFGERARGRGKGATDAWCER